jgi:hypothetical protein
MVKHLTGNSAKIGLQAFTFNHQENFALVDSPDTWVYIYISGLFSSLLRVAVFVALSTTLGHHTNLLAPLDTRWSLMPLASQAKDFP